MPNGTAITGASGTGLCSPLCRGISGAGFAIAQMTDPRAHQLETLIREVCAWHHAVDAPDHDAHTMLMRHLEDIRPHIRADEALRLRELIERRTGVKG